jgi:DNA polymerase-3 subunit gamma/tau
VSVPRPTSPASLPPVSVKPAFSPFEQDTSRRKYDNVPTGLESSASSGANALASAPAPVSAPHAVLQPAPVDAPKPVIVATPIPVAAPVPVPEPLPVAAPLPTPEPEVVVRPVEAVAPTLTGEDTSAIQKAMMDALQQAGQGSAAEAIEDSNITLGNGEARIQTQLSKTLLPITINPEAEKLVRSALRAHGVIKLTLLPGIGSSTAAKKPRAARSGSAQAKAEQHPLVQQARKLFDAELQQVIDLSEDA